MTTFEIIFSSALALLGWFVKSRITSIEKDVIDLRNDIYELKENYLDRFEKVNNCIHDSKVETHNKINDSKIEIIDKLHKLEISIKGKK